jgi:hypothetical protein
MSGKKQYIGVSADKPHTRFTSDKEPTRESHGDEHAAVIGPFKTKRGAEWAEKHGKGNPHFTGVHAAEQFAHEEYANTTKKK